MHAVQLQASSAIPSLPPGCSSPNSPPQPSDLRFLRFGSSGLLLGPLSDRSIFLTSFVYFSSLLMWHLPSKAVLACPLPAKCNSAPAPQIPIPSVGLACLHGPFCCGHRTCFRCSSCLLSVCPPGLCTPHRKKFCVIYLQLKIVPSTFNVFGKYREMPLRGSDLTRCEEGFSDLVRTEGRPVSTGQPYRQPQPPSDRASVVS